MAKEYKSLIQGYVKSKKEVEDLLDSVETELIEFGTQLSSKVVSYETFLNFFENIDVTIKNSNNLMLVDKAIRMVFLNFTLDGEKVANYQLNPMIEGLLKSHSVLNGRGDRTRTCDLAHPMRAF